MATSVSNPSAPEGGREVSRTSPEDPLLELPAWPALCLLWGLPLWWVVGLYPLASVVVAPAMLFYLTARRHVWLVPGILPFLALAVWTGVGILAIEPHYLVGWGVRFVQYASAAILLVYVVNAPFQLTRRRILTGLSAMYVFVLVGGYLGMVKPYGRLTHTVSLLLPRGIQGNSFAQQLFVPNFAEIQTPYGAAAPFLRPSAPFSFANGWGAAMTFLIPVVIAAALDRGTTQAKVLTLVGLGLAIPPAVAANNRGMLLALAVAFAVVVLRSAAHGHLGAVVGVTALTGVAAFMMVRLGLVQSLGDRATTGQSVQGRGSLYAETWQRTLESPILGHGAPRPSYTSEITVGTQGAIWAAMFCSGFVGLAFLLYFLAGLVVRTLDLHSLPDVWLNGALVATLVMSTYYGLDRMLVPLVILGGMMLRDKYLQRMQSAGAG